MLAVRDGAPCDLDVERTEAQPRVADAEPSRACPWPAASVPPRRRVCRDRGPARRVAWARVAGHRRAVSGDPRPLGLRRRAGAGGPDVRLTRWCVARGEGAARCAGRRYGPGGAARHAASPVRAAPDTPRVGLARIRLRAAVRRQSWRKRVGTPVLYHLPLRQAEGFLHALFGMMRLDLSAPDYTTLSRRSQHLTRRLRPVPPGAGIHLVLDSTGLSIVGEGEWAAAKHGGCGRRGWRKLYLGVDQSGVIRVHTLTEATGDDATTALDLLTAVEGSLVRVTADAAYDTVAVYETAGARGATVVIPPARTANVSGHGPRSPARDRTITLVKTLGRRRWKKASGYHRQGRVENAFFRYKSIIGDGLRARSPAGQGSEVVLGCEILNRMTALGRSVSYRIGR